MVIPAHTYGHQNAFEALFDRLKNDPNYDYETVLAVQDLVEDYEDEGTFLGRVATASDSTGCYDDIPSLGKDLKTLAYIGDLADGMEWTVFHNSTDLFERIKDGLTAADSALEKLSDLRILAAETGLIAWGDEDTDVAPLLRMFLPT